MERLGIPEIIARAVHPRHPDVQVGYASGGTALSAERRNRVGESECGIEARGARRAREAQLIFTKTRLQLTPEDPRVHKILYRRRRVAATGAVN